MTTLKEAAMAYEPQQTQNIADLEVVPTNIGVFDRECKDSEGTPFTMKIATIDGIDYRVPVSVLKALQAILIEKPNLTSFKVVKTGKNMNTSYTVVPLG